MCANIVEENRHQTVGRAVLDADIDIEETAVLAPVPGLNVRTSLREDFLDGGGDFPGAVAGIEIGDTHGQELLLAVAAHLAIGRVDFLDAALRVHQAEAVHGRQQDCPVALTDLPGRFQCLGLALFRLDEIAHDARLPPPVIQRDQGHCQQDEHPGNEGNGRRLGVHLGVNFRRIHLGHDVPGRVGNRPQVTEHLSRFVVQAHENAR